MKNTLFESVINNSNFISAIALIDYIYSDVNTTSDDIISLHNHISNDIPAEVRDETLLYLEMRSALHSIGFSVDVKPYDLVFDHTSTMRGYVSVKRLYADPYCGRFGKGVKIRRNNPESTRYAYCGYYIYKI